LTLNFHFISFSPFGIPFRIDTEVGGQPLSMHFVQGLGVQQIRLKDQELALARLLNMSGKSFTAQGSVMIDMNLILKNNLINTFSLKVLSKDLQAPSQSIEVQQIPISIPA